MVVPGEVVYPCSLLPRCPGGCRGSCWLWTPLANLHCSSTDEAAYWSSLGRGAPQIQEEKPLPPTTWCQLTKESYLQGLSLLLQKRTMKGIWELRGDTLIMPTAGVNLEVLLLRNKVSEDTKEQGVLWDWIIASKTLARNELPKGMFERGFLGPNLGVSDSGGLQWGLVISLSYQFPENADNVHPKRSFLLPWRDLFLLKSVLFFILWSGPHFE